MPAPTPRELVSLMREAADATVAAPEPDACPADALETQAPGPDLGVSDRHAGVAGRQAYAFLKGHETLSRLNEMLGGEATVYAIGELAGALWRGSRRCAAAQLAIVASTSSAASRVLQHAKTLADDFRASHARACLRFWGSSGLGRGTIECAVVEIVRLVWPSLDSLLHSGYTALAHDGTRARAAAVQASAATSLGRFIRFPEQNTIASPDTDSGLPELEFTVLGSPCFVGDGQVCCREPTAEQIAYDYRTDPSSSERAAAVLGAHLRTQLRTGRPSAVASRAHLAREMSERGRRLLAECERARTQPGEPGFPWQFVPEWLPSARQRLLDDIGEAFPDVD